MSTGTKNTCPTIVTIPQKPHPKPAGNFPTGGSRQDLPPTQNRVTSF